MHSGLMQIQNELKQLRFVLKDSTASDSSKKAAKDKIRKITSDKVNRQVSTSPVVLDIAPLVGYKYKILSGFEYQLALCLQ